MYPKDTQEVDKFVAGIIKSLHSDQTRDQIMQVLTDERAPVAARLATVVSMVMTAMLQRVQTQAGRKPHINLLTKAIKMIIVEASRMAMIAGVRVTLEDQKNAAKLAGDMIEDGMKGGQRQPMAQQSNQQQMQQPQQPMAQPGIVQGAMR